MAILGEDELIGHGWYRREEYDEQGILFPLAPGEVWGYDAWVAGRHRGRGHGTRLLLSVDHVNEPMLRATRAGMRVPIGSVWMLRVLGISLRWPARVPARAGGAAPRRAS